MMDDCGDICSKNYFLHLLFESSYCRCCILSWQPCRPIVKRIEKIILAIYYQWIGIHYRCSMMQKKWIESFVFIKKHFFKSSGYFGPIIEYPLQLWNIIMYLNLISNIYKFLFIIGEWEQRKPYRREGNKRLNFLLFLKNFINYTVKSWYFLFLSLSNLPDSMMGEIKSLIYNFVWKGKPDNKQTILFILCRKCNNKLPLEGEKVLIQINHMWIILEMWTLWIAIQVILIKFNSSIIELYKTMHQEYISAGFITVADPGSVKRGGRESKFLDAAPENRPKKQKSAEKKGGPRTIRPPPPGSATALYPRQTKFEGDILESACRWSVRCKFASRTA